MVVVYLLFAATPSMDLASANSSAPSSPGRGTRSTRRASSLARWTQESAIPVSGSTTVGPFSSCTSSPFSRRLKGLTKAKRRELLGEPWGFKAWLVEDDGGEQMMRHILLHLLFPEEFERIASGTHKNRIRDQLIGLVEPERWLRRSGTETEEDIDRQLLDIRKKIGELMPDGQASGDGQIELYYSPLPEAWDPGDLTKAMTLASDQQSRRARIQAPGVLFGPAWNREDLRPRTRSAALCTTKRSRGGARSPTSAIRRRSRRRSSGRSGAYSSTRYSYEDFIRGLRMTPDGTVPIDGYLCNSSPTSRRPSRRPGIESRCPGCSSSTRSIAPTSVACSANCSRCSRTTTRRSTCRPSTRGRRSARCRLPPDLFFIGTMNLIDQSVEQLDFALRRRFSGYRQDPQGPHRASGRAEVGGARRDRTTPSLRVRHNPWDRFRDGMDRRPSGPRRRPQPRDRGIQSPRRAV